MRVFFAALIFCALSLPAHASWLMPQVAAERHVIARHHYAHEGWHRPHYAHFDVGRMVLSAACQIARSLGGPCGCFASEQVFGHSVRNLWLADAWLKFPRTSPHSGAVAVWPHRHVALAVSDPHGGRITVRDSWATHDVRIAGLIFVDPHAGRYAALRRRYARADF